MSSASKKGVFLLASILENQFVHESSVRYAHLSWLFNRRRHNSGLSRHHSRNPFHYSHATFTGAAFGYKYGALVDRLNYPILFDL